MRMLALVKAVAAKEMRQIARDPRTLLILLFVPAFFLFVYGYALNFDIRDIRMLVQDGDRSTASRDLVSAFVNSGYFDLVGTIEHEGEIGAALERGGARAVLVIPSGFARDTARGRPARVQVLINGDNANTATAVSGYVTGIVTGVSTRAEASLRLLRSGAPPVTLEPRVWYNPELRSTLFLVPGLIAYIAMLTAVVSTALSVVREKEAGTMEQIRMAPLGPLPYILGKAAPYFLIAMTVSMSIVPASMLLFDLPMRGSWLVLVLCVGLFLIGALGVGLLISTIAETQQVAFQVALLSSFLPTLMLSGFIFPIASMPPFLQRITYLVPARYFLVALRAIVLKGAGAMAFWQDLAALAIFATVATFLASMRLRREWS